MEPSQLQFKEKERESDIERESHTLILVQREKALSLLDHTPHSTTNPKISERKRELKYLEGGFV